MNKKFMTFFFSVLLIAFSLGFSQSVVNAATATPIGWKYINNTWYYLDANGNKVTNKWQQDKSLKWFYLSSTGAMAKNKWQQDNSTRWFYLGADGAMVSNKWQQDSSKKWFYLGSDGGMVTSAWQTDSSKRKFYLGTDGAMTANSFVTDSAGRRYYCGADGAMAVSTFVTDYTGKKYFAGADGIIKTSSWVSNNGNWYYVSTDGSLAVSTLTPDGYRVDSNGVWDGKPILVSDNQPPVIKLMGSSNITIDGGTAFADPGVTITDNVDSSVKVITSITDSIGRFYAKVDTSTKGTYIITYNATDAAGNKAAPVTRTVTVTSSVVIIDTTAPVITLKGYANVTVKNGLIYADAGASAADDVDTTVSVYSSITNSSGVKIAKVDTTKAGTYTITYTAADAAGNKAVPVVRTVTVKPAGAPISYAIDIGHNAAYDSGAVGIRNENDCTKEVGTLVISKLRALGYDVVSTAPTRTPTSTKDSLQQRCDAANSSGADYFVSIHFNVFNGTANGTEVYYFDGNDVGKVLATYVVNDVTALGYTNRGVKANSTYYVLRNTDMPSILIECAFLDSTTDMNLYNPDAMASAIVKGLTEKP
ncbi:MAG: N-acetylmuramoyl-L-alanine amidase [Solirubrobacterales bacterium]